jgi:hypothetical protein
MKILTEYSFKKEGRSRYEEAVKALCDEGVYAVELKRGEDFPENLSPQSASGGIRGLIAKRGYRARCFIESDDVLVVSLWSEGEGPKARRKRQKVAA